MTAFDFFHQFSCLFPALSNSLRFCTGSSSSTPSTDPADRAFCVWCAQQPFRLRRLQSKNGKQQVPLSTATVSMVHSVPELMVSSEVSPPRGRAAGKHLLRALCGARGHAHSVVASEVTTGGTTLVRSVCLSCPGIPPACAPPWPLEQHRHGLGPHEQWSVKSRSGLGAGMGSSRSA